MIKYLESRCMLPLLIFDILKLEIALVYVMHLWLLITFPYGQLAYYLHKIRDRSILGIYLNHWWVEKVIIDMKTNFELPINNLGFWDKFILENV